MKKTVAIVALCLLASALLMVWGAREVPAGDEGPAARYVLLLEEDSGTAIMQLKQGAQTAASELGAEWSTQVAEQREPPAEALVAMASRLVEEGVSGLVLSPSAPETVAAVREIAGARGIPVVCVGADAPGADASVLTDPAAEGRLLVEACLAAPSVAADQVTVLMADDAVCHARLEGIRALLTPAAILVEDADGAARALSALPQGTPVLVLDAQLALAAAQSHGDALLLWGVDPGDDRVPLLAAGQLQGIVVEMPYAQGYQAVMALDGLRQGQPVPQTVHSASRLVTRQTMYLSENVKLMFPLLQ